MVRLFWTKQAVEDLLAIQDFIAKDSVKYAKIQISKIKTTARIVKTNPYSGRKVPEIKRNEIRELILGNYRIIYRIVSDTRADILTIHHSARLLTENILSP